MKTGNTSMTGYYATQYEMPQWSPVMKTGNTSITKMLATPSGGLNGARS